MSPNHLHRSARTLPKFQSLITMFGQYFPDGKYARDTSYRSSKIDTHPTHGCIPLFCGSWSALSAPSEILRTKNGSYPGFFERADSALCRWQS